MSCLVCNVAEATAGALCSACASRLCGRTALCPEQIASAEASAPVACIVDQWGRVHHVHPSGSIVGRQPGGGGVTVAEPSVSRAHARIDYDGTRCSVVDLESTNGTFVDGDRILTRRALTDGCRVTFGEVSFSFRMAVPAANAPGATSLPTARPEPYDADEDREETFAGLRTVSMSLVAPSGGGGGVVDIAGTRVQLTLAQFELVRMLAERMLAEPDRDERVRGFVRSSELCASLPWDTARPDEGHMKQLVRRLRRSLERGGAADIIESRHGFGYRLRVNPRLR